MNKQYKKIVWLDKHPKTPPMSLSARREIGFLLRLLQSGILLDLPQSRQMQTIGKRCYELRVNEADVTWRLFYRIDNDAIIIADWNKKKTQTTSKKQIELCKKRFKFYDISKVGKNEKER